MTKVSLSVIISAVIQLLLINGIRAQRNRGAMRLSKIYDPIPFIVHQDTLRDSIQHALIKQGTPENRYDAFEDLISRLHRECREYAFEWIIADSKVDTARKEAIKSEINGFYAGNVRNYPEQFKQAILNGQEPRPIVENSDTGSKALCSQIISLAESKVSAANGK